MISAAASVPEFARILRGEDLAFAAFDRTPDEFMRACADEDLSGLVHERVRALPDDAEWPFPVRETLAREAREHMVAELARRAQIVVVLDALAAGGVRPLLFKGTALAYTLYQVPHLRPRLDTDLFIDRADLEAVTRTFVALGYSQPAYCDGELLFGQVMFTKTDALGIDHVFDVHWRVSTQSVAASARHVRGAVRCGGRRPGARPRRTERRSRPRVTPGLRARCRPSSQRGTADLDPRHPLAGVPAVGLPNSRSLFASRSPVASPRCVLTV